jgi:hypothetical protein
MIPALSRLLMFIAKNCAVFYTGPNGRRVERPLGPESLVMPRRESSTGQSSTSANGCPDGVITVTLHDPEMPYPGDLPEESFEGLQGDDVPTLIKYAKDALKGMERAGWARREPSRVRRIEAYSVVETIHHRARRARDDIRSCKSDAMYSLNAIVERGRAVFRLPHSVETITQTIEAAMREAERENTSVPTTRSISTSPAPTAAATETAGSESPIEKPSEPESSKNAAAGAETTITPAAAGRGVSRSVLAKKAEEWVKRHGNQFPGVQALARQLRCAKSSLGNAIKESVYLKARKAEYDKGRKGKPCEIALTGVHQDSIPQSTEPDPSEDAQRDEELNKLIAEQERDMKADERPSRRKPVPQAD